MIELVEKALDCGLISLRDAEELTRAVLIMEQNGADIETIYHDIRTAIALRAGS